MDPPFIVGKVVRPPYFIDREGELNRLVNALGTLSENQLVVALRRMGKSSLLFNAVEALRDKHPRTLVASLDCRKITNAESFVDELVVEVLHAYQHAHPVTGWLRLKGRLWTDRITDVLPEVQKVGGSVGPLFAAYVEIREKKITPETFVARAFAFLEGFTKDGEGGLVVVLDEFQELDKLGAPYIFQFFKSYSDRLQRVRFCFSGSSVSVLNRIFLQPDSPLYLMAGKLPLEPLPLPVVERFLADRFRVAGMTIEPAAAARLHALTGGIPYYVQKLGLSVWLSALAGNHATIPLALVEAAFQEVIWELSSEFEARFEHKYGAQQKAILLELAQHGSLLRNDLAKSTNRTTGTLSQGLIALETAMEIRKPSRGRYEMCDPVFARWIQDTVRERRSSTAPRKRTPRTRHAKRS